MSVNSRSNQTSSPFLLLSYICWLSSRLQRFFISYLFPDNWDNKLNSIWNSFQLKIQFWCLWFFTFLFYFHTVLYKEKKIASWCTGLKALANCCQTKGIFFFDPLETICAVRGNLKGNHIQSVVELNAWPQKTNPTSGGACTLIAFSLTTGSHCLLLTNEDN